MFFSKSHSSTVWRLNNKPCDRREGSETIYELIDKDEVDIVIESACSWGKKYCFIIHFYNYIPLLSKKTLIIQYSHKIFN